MREITASQIKDTIKSLIININYEIGDNGLSSLKCALDREVSPVGKAILSQIIENDIIAKNERVAMCQDTGMAVVFAEVGQDVHITGGNFVDAINQGVREAYSEGCLRKSIVAAPLFDRKNTADNTPAVIYTDIVPGDKIKLTVTC